MKILVFSDSHGYEDGMRAALTAHAASTDLVLHLGDGTDDFEAVMRDYPTLAARAFAGNREAFLSSAFSFDAPDAEDVIPAGEHRILAMHGHRYGVKSGTDGALARAYALGADILLYGHTHRPDSRVTEIGGRTFYLFNPGSVGAGYPLTYGVLTIGADGDVKTEIIPVGDRL